MTYEYQDLELMLSIDDLLLVVSEALGPLTGLGKLDRIEPNYIRIVSLSEDEVEWINAQLKIAELDDTVLTAVLWPVIVPIHSIKLISVIRHEHETTQQEETPTNDGDNNTGDADSEDADSSTEDEKTSEGNPEVKI